MDFPFPAIIPDNLKLKKMKHAETHISSYRSLALILTLLLFLTTVSVLVTGWHLGPLSVAVALIIASIKVRTVITHFMHVKFETFFLKALITGVFALYAIVIIITFIDYYLR
jgi:cytochrome c oxidase subunit IV